MAGWEFSETNAAFTLVAVACLWLGLYNLRLILRLSEQVRGLEERVSFLTRRQITWAEPDERAG